MISSIAKAPLHLAIFNLPGGTEWIVLLVIGLLLFGRRLPEVGRSLGRGIVEFKKGIKGIEDEVEDASTAPAPRKAPQVEAQSGAASVAHTSESSSKHSA